MNLLTYSLELDCLVNDLRQINSFHSYRYSYFTRSSPQGENCQYAILTARKHLETREREQQALRELGERLIALSKQEVQ